MGRAALYEFRYLSAIEEASSASGIARTKDVSGLLQVTPATVTERVKALARKGLVEYRPYQGTSLTQLGRNHLGSILRRVRLLERFLLIIGMSDEGARSQAERMGPMIGSESYSRLLDLVAEMESSSLPGDRDGGDVPRPPNVAVILNS